MEKNHNFDLEKTPQKDAPHSRPLPPDFTAMMVINEISKLFHDNIRNNVEKLGVKGGYRHLLFHLAFNDGCSQFELAKKTHLKAPTVSVTLQNMESDGFIRRETDENDLRSYKIFLTEKGWEYHRLVREAIKKFEEQLMEGVSDEDTESLKRILLVLRNNLLDKYYPERRSAPDEAR